MLATTKVGFNQLQHGPLNIVFACLGVKDTFHIAQRINKYWQGAVQTIQPSSRVIQNEYEMKTFFSMRLKYFQESCLAKDIDTYEFDSADPKGEKFYKMWPRSLISNGLPRPLELYSRQPPVYYRVDETNCKNATASKIESYPNFDYLGDCQNYAVYGRSALILQNKFNGKIIELTSNEAISRFRTKILNFFEIEFNLIGAINNEGTVLIWKVEKEQAILIKKLSICNYHIANAVFNPNNKTIYACDENHLLTFCLQKEKTLSIEFFKSIYALKVFSTCVIIQHIEGITCLDLELSTRWHVSYPEHHYSFPMSPLNCNEHWLLISNIAAINLVTGKVFKAPQKINNLVLWGSAAIGIRQTKGTDLPCVVMWDISSGHVAECPIKVEQGSKRSYIHAVCSDSKAKAIYGIVSHVFDNSFLFWKRPLVAKISIIKLEWPH